MTNVLILGANGQLARKHDPRRSYSRAGRRAPEEWAVRARGLDPDAAACMLAAWKARASAG